MAETHRVLTDVAHCLQRPDMFIGSVVPQDIKYWRFVPQQDSYVVEAATATLPPAFSQLFLEIATNATDQAARPNSNVKNIRVTMDDVTGRVAVENDGSGICIRPHAQFPDKYLPTVIFSEFRCGQNFDDTVERKGAGRNGYGAKCTNAWSTEFEVDTVDDEHHFVQRWTHNMAHMSAARITKAHRKPYTRISFIPDYARLHITDIAGALQYLRTFVWHLCPVTDPKLQVWLDGVKLPVRNLKDYARMLSADQTLLYEDGVNMQIAVVAARPGIENAIGFVNGIPCSTGTHVNYVMNRLSQQAPLIPVAVLKAHAMVLVNVTVINPTFTSQTKEQLSLDMRRSGASWEPTPLFIKNFKRSSIFDAIKEEHDLRETRKAKAAAGKGTGVRARYVQVEGYESAVQAGNPKRTTPTSIILTEGDSAKGFAISGLSVVGREHYGVFPLRGKLKNVRGEKLSTILQTTEIANILKILGVDMSARTPQTTRDLRYDRVIMLTDQDVDGAHIAGLIINALMVLMPDIFKNEPTFVQRFATPLVRATTTKAENREFMTEREFNDWYQQLPAQHGYTIKYYKGLGTSTPKDAKLCFQHLSKYLITIDCQQGADQELLVDFFDSKRAAQRKALLMQPIQLEDKVDYTQDRVLLGKFLMSELLEFSRYNNERSLAHVIDGFKPAQRKILWTMLTSAVGSIKVAQLSGEVAKRTHYKHGEASLNETIVKMAQDFPLSGNNINLLMPDGMFGNRHGDEAASPRYIYTRVEPIAKALFPADDFPILNMLQQEGETIEPMFMVPVIPMVLINGTSGIGSGFSSDVPPFNPRDVMAWCRAYILHRQSGGGVAPTFTALPWWEGFAGPIEPRERGVVLQGVLQRTTEQQVVVTDLPRATNDYRLHPKKDEALLQAYPHQCIVANTDVHVHLTLQFEQPVSPELWHKLQQRAQLQVDMTNMTLWSAQTLYPVVYASAQAILLEHAQIRAAYYVRRKAHQMQELQASILRNGEEYRFICQVMDEPTFLMRQAHDVVVARLQAARYVPINGSFEHLLRLPVAAMTQEQLAKLKRQSEQLTQTLQALEKQSEWDLWLADLVKLDEAYVRFVAERQERRSVPAENGPGSGAGVVENRPKKRKTTGPTRDHTIRPATKVP